MGSYRPLYIKGNTTGLIQSRQNFILPNDAYPVLENAYVWRERIKRKQGCQLLGRLQRYLVNVSVGVSGSNPQQFNIYSAAGITGEPNAQIEAGSVIVNIGPSTYTDLGNGTFQAGPGVGNGIINYANGNVYINTGEGPGNSITISFSYFPGLPVMGLRTWDQYGLFNNTIAFDKKYAYFWNGSLGTWQEWLYSSGQNVTWNASGQNDSNINFFWTTNYWNEPVDNPYGFPVANKGAKYFWITNNTGSQAGSLDPIRISNGMSYLTPFNPTVDGTNNLYQCLALIPFRGRLLSFNTWEGPNTGDLTNYFNRIRWCVIGNPFDVNAWNDTIRGKGGFLNIPTNEDIVTVGFVRDNLVIYCEQSTWQLRYTGNQLAPFQIEKVNSELGVEGTFSQVQFDTSLMGIGDKGIVECDSFKSERIDIKLPDFVFNINQLNNGPNRVYGIRDFELRIAYWCFPSYTPEGIYTPIFPDRRLVYNYENDSWAIFKDSYTCFGIFQAPSQSNRTWLDTNIPWIQCNFPWTEQISGNPNIIGGNQQGYVEYLQQQTLNDQSLFISQITADGTNLLTIFSPNHNLDSDDYITINGIISAPYSNMNNVVYQISVLDANSFNLYSYNSNTMNFDISVINPLAFIGTIYAITTGSTVVVYVLQATTLVTGNQITLMNLPGMPSLNNKTFTITVLNPMHFILNNTTSSDVYVSGGTVCAAYIGNGVIQVRDNFNITSKKFNFMEEGQNIQLGHIDILMDNGGSIQNPGGITLQIYQDYNDATPINTLNVNELINSSPPATDPFFNTVIPTSAPNDGTNYFNTIGGTKYLQRVYCQLRGTYLTLQYTFSDAQMAGLESEQDVQIDSQTLWMRPAGRSTSY